MSSNFQENTLSKALTKVKRALLGVGLISCLVNLLMLTGPLFMLQVYDRVLASGSVPTLVVLLALVVGLYVLAGGFDFIRTLVLARTAFWIENNVGRTSFAHWIATPTDPTKPGYRPLQDLSAVRQFLSTPIAGALFDLPWFPFYLAIVFVLHPMLGWLAVGGAIVVVVLALINEAVTSKSAAEASGADLRESRFADQSKQNMETIRAMGMATGIGNVWSEFRNRSLGLHQTSGERSQVFAATSKYTRMLLQSCILALGAYLAINQEISAGAIVAASIIAGRALAPIDQVIGGWRNVKSTRLSYNRLKEFLDGYKGEGQEKVSLPDPKGPLSVEAVTKIGMTTPGEPNKPPILTNVSFQLEPGDGLGVIGPSAAGKSSLAKLLVGIWLPERGAVRLDGATFDQWDPTLLGPHIGYVPQDAALMSGTIAQNISRFENEPEDQEVVEAAKTAGVHQMILRLPDGYSTPLDTAVSPLSGGQRQRIALARALYRKPHLIVLDEPNSNLDAEGDAALAEAIKKMRENGSIVVVMAHRPSAIAAVNKVLMLANGQVMDFGDKADVLQRVTRAA